MELIRYVQTRRWPTLFGYALFIGMMATGYYYNVTFVQLGLVDLGTRLIGMSEQAVATQIAYLALLTCLIALGFGFYMQKRGWGREFVVKLRLAFGVVLVQTILTVVAPSIRSEAAFLAWIILASGALGVGVPVTFSLMVDLIPRQDRGYVAAAITAAAYLAANVLPSAWTIESFAAQMIGPMVGGAIGLGALAFGRFAFVHELAQQQARPEFRYGRYLRRDTTGRTRVSRRLLGLIVVMFGVYFVDSLGFLRLVATPAFMEAAWQSPELGPRLFIGGFHVLAAFIAGVLYSALDERHLFLWIFGIFALAHLMYVFQIRLAPDRPSALVEPMLYAMAVSLYTVVNFAIWADLSTPDTISMNSALGVALSGWTATFISTALAMQWQAGQMPLEQHLSLVDSLAMLFFVALLALAFFPARANACLTTRGNP